MADTVIVRDSPVAAADNLPAQLTSFVGRGIELVAVRKLLAERRLLTLSGAGGCGKTRLALQAAAAAADRWPDGVWWVDLGSVSDPTLVPRLAASAGRVLVEPADPELALAEARRVLRPGGLLAVCTSSRYNDPELASVLPSWGQPTSFDAENGLDTLSQVFDIVDVQRWDAPLVRLPDRGALALFLRGRGLSEEDAQQQGDHLETPMTVTKRGMLAWARRPPA